LKKKALDDKDLNKYINQELKDFSLDLVSFIKKAGNVSSLSQSEAKEKELSKQYIEKLIEYIGKCVKLEESNETIKHLLISFIQVLEIAGEDEITQKAKRKAKKFVIVSTNILNIDNIR